MKKILALVCSSIPIVLVCTAIGLTFISCIGQTESSGLWTRLAICAICGEILFAAAFLSMFFAWTRQMKGMRSYTDEVLQMWRDKRNKMDTIATALDVFESSGRKDLEGFLEVLRRSLGKEHIAEETGG